MLWRSLGHLAVNVEIGCDGFEPAQDQLARLAFGVGASHSGAGSTEVEVDAAVRSAIFSDEKYAIRSSAAPARIVPALGVAGRRGCCRQRAIGIAWRQATVSEVERSQRNVTVTEILGLAITLNATVEQFIDTRGPASRVGPQLVLADQVDEPAALPFLPSSTTVLVCPHKLYAEVEWVENKLQSMSIKAVDELAS